MLWARAERIALRRRALLSGSPPAVLAAMVISRASLLKSAPRFTSIAPLMRLTLDHLLCPDMRWEFYELPDRSAFFREPRKASNGPLSRRQITGENKPPEPVFVNKMGEPQAAF